MQIIRKFYPVGQGAFYSEKIEGFNLVYDCGSLNKTKSRAIVESAFTSDDVVDLLVISHLDKDHVSCIDILKASVKEIDKVLMPLISEVEKHLILNFYNVSNQTHDESIEIPLYEQLVLRPEEYFGSQTKVIYVDAAEGGEGVDLIESQAIELANVGTLIPSGCKLSVTPFWFLVPYNFNSFKRRKCLYRKMEEAGIDLSMMESFPESALHYVVNHRNQLWSIYNQIEGTVNSNSLILLSCPTNTFEAYAIDFKPAELGLVQNIKLRYMQSALRAGAIYTGDIDLQTIDLTKVFLNMMDKVGFIQVPHHGSKYSFYQKIPSNLDSFVNSNKIIWFVSYGERNTYSHPHSQVTSLLSPLIKVSDDVLTGHEHAVINQSSKFVEWSLKYF
jgi:hypothetical protein